MSMDAEEQETSLGLPRRSLNDLLHGWAAFVAEVERGYCYSIYDYVNDLNLRTAIGTHPRLSQSSSIRSRLESWDVRFLGATSDAQSEVLTGQFDERFRWLARVPIKLEPELAQDLADSE